jgi:peptidoglycan hydrolase-like protein with peptidoglycan-binding domain
VAKAPAKSTATAPAASSAKKKSSKSKTKSAKSRRPPRQMAPEAERIREIQQALTDHGFAVPVTGQWGAESVAALKQFQEAQKLPAKGKLDSLTLISLGLGPKHEPAPELPPPIKD